MINPTELRIGNLLWYDLGKDPRTHRSVTVSQIANKVITCIDYGLPLAVFADKIKPIPLTTENLERLGFEEDTQHECYVIYKHSDVPFAIEYYDGEIHLVGFNMADSMENIKHVHQLQNLYFALTGQELTLG